VAAPNESDAASSASAGGRPDVDLTGDGAAAPALRVRRIAADEGPHLRQVRLDAIADSPGTFTTNLEAAAARPAEAWMRVAEAHSSAGDQATWFAEVGEATAGMVSAFRTDDGAVTMTSLWSAPGFRQRGVADALVAEVHAWAVRGGATEIRQWLVERNAHARAFHESLGFLPTGFERPYEPAPELREVELRLPLS